MNYNESLWATIGLFTVSNAILTSRQGNLGAIIKHHTNLLKFRSRAPFYKQFSTFSLTSSKSSTARISSYLSNRALLCFLCLQLVVICPKNMWRFANLQPRYSKQRMNKISPSRWQTGSYSRTTRDTNFDKIINSLRETKYFILSHGFFKRVQCIDEFPHSINFDYFYFSCRIIRIQL